MRSAFYLAAVVALVLSVAFLARRLRQDSSPFSGADVISGLQALTNRVEALDSGPRAWTDKRGRRILARILAATPSTVTIRRESDGQVFTISVLVLSDADRAFVQRWRTQGVR